MSDSAGGQLPQRLPHAGRTGPFARMGRGKQAALLSVVVSRLMRRQGKRCFIAGYVQTNHVAAAEPLHQPDSLHALLARVVPKRTENKPGLNPSARNTSLNGFIHGRDYGLRRKALFKMKQRCKAELGVNQV